MTGDNRDTIIKDMAVRNFIQEKAALMIQSLRIPTGLRLVRFLINGFHVNFQGELAQEEVIDTYGTSDQGSYETSRAYNI